MDTPGSSGQRSRGSPLWGCLHRQFVHSWSVFVTPLGTARYRYIIRSRGSPSRRVAANNTCTVRCFLLLPIPTLYRYCNLYCTETFLYSSFKALRVRIQGEGACNCGSNFSAPLLGRLLWYLSCRNKKDTRRRHRNQRAVKSEFG